MLELGPEALAACLTAVGDHLAAAREQHAIVIVGGAALNLAGHLRRTTQDLLALQPTDDELDLARAWVVRQDIGPGFAKMVDDAVAWLRERRRGQP